MLADCETVHDERCSVALDGEFDLLAVQQAVPVGVRLQGIGPESPLKEIGALTERGTSLPFACRTHAQSRALARVESLETPGKYVVVLKLAARPSLKPRRRSSKLVQTP